MNKSLEIIKEVSHEDTSLKLLDLIKQNISNNSTASIGLSGGNTPKYLYQHLAKEPLDTILKIWTVDDRHVTLDDKNSNQKMINDIFGESKHKILEISYSEDPSEWAKNYNDLVLSEINKFAKCKTERAGCPIDSCSACAVDTVRVLAREGSLDHMGGKKRKGAMP